MYRPPGSRQAITLIEGAPSSACRKPPAIWDRGQMHVPQSPDSKRVPPLPSMGLPLLSPLPPHLPPTIRLPDPPPSQIFSFTRSLEMSVWLGLCPKLAPLMPERSWPWADETQDRSVHPRVRFLQNYVHFLVGRGGLTYF